MRYNSDAFKANCLKGKVALVTGGGTGIGKGITKRFMELGADVIIFGRRYNKLLETAKELCSLTNSTCYPFKVDIRSYEAVAAAIDEALNKTNGQLDILVNCAAGNFLARAQNLSYNAFKTVMEIDAHGTFIVSSLAFKKALQKSGGCIINISMTLHYVGAYMQTHAGAAKAAVDAMTKHLAVEWGPYNVRVNGIAPGPIADTPGMQKLNVVDKGNDINQKSEGDVSDGNKKPKGGSESDMLAQFVPLQRLGTAKDVANAAVFLSLDVASYITGATVIVDGGQWLTCGNFPLLSPQQFVNWSTKSHQQSKL